MVGSEQTVLMMITARCMLHHSRLTHAVITCDAVTCNDSCKVQFVCTGSEAGEDKWAVAQPVPQRCAQPPPPGCAALPGQHGGCPACPGCQVSLQCLQRLSCAVLVG